MLVVMKRDATREQIDAVVARIEKDVHHATWGEVNSFFVSAGLRNIRRRKFNFLFPVLVTTGDA